MNAVPVTAIITAYQRVEQTLHTLTQIQNCRPPPAEILVHVDGGEKTCAKAILDSCPEVKIITSEENLGPGGGRNKLIAAAEYEFVASFDDDSYPIDVDYFSRLIQIFNRFPEALILDARVYLPGEQIREDLKKGQWVASFSGGACCYNRDLFLQLKGYVPIPIAYGMEEVDLSLQISAAGGKILKTDWLRVYHDTNLKRHDEPNITSNSIMNITLLTYLHYPLMLWWIGAIQVTKRIIWLICNGRWRGILSGLVMMPQHIYKYRTYRETYSSKVIISNLIMRRHPVDIEY